MRGAEMIKTISRATSGILEPARDIGIYGLSVGLGIGWLYWIYVGVKLGSFAMVIFGLLGPLGILASALGLWSLFFGIPLWLFYLVS
jgi:hypothetical protein